MQFEADITDPHSTFMIMQAAKMILPMPTQSSKTHRIDRHAWQTDTKHIHYFHYMDDKHWCRLYMVHERETTKC